jgi:hypothetical protein
MDGDNKINCDVCNEKKATTRATCFDELPNSFIIHLKRFDLDFETFETVKLNNRLSFPVTLNMYKFTRHAREAAEKNEKAKETEVGGDDHDHDLQRIPSKDNDDNSNKDVIVEGDADVEGAVNVDADSGDVGDNGSNGDNVDDLSGFEYELQGVLVHAGIAQGGHYYSFIRDNQSKWYRFDDEEVTAFDPNNISEECFGGPSVPKSPGYGPKPAAEHTHDRTSNALMLFYRKKTTQMISNNESDTTSTSSIVDVQTSLEKTRLTAESKKKDDRFQNLSPDLVDGYGAFMREVQEFNIDHAVSKQLLDAELHDFMLYVLNLANDKKYLNTLSSDHINSQIQSIVKFTSSFFFDVILHCRDRSNVQKWIEQLKAVYSHHSYLATEFLATVLSTDNSWLVEYLLHCNDEGARSCFVSLFASIMHDCVSSVDFKALTFTAFEEKGEAGKFSETTMLVQESMRKIIQALTYEVFKFPATSAGLLSLVGELSKIPVLRKCFLDLDTIELLVSIVVPSRCNDDIKHILTMNKSAKLDLQALQPSAVDTVAALIGSPQIAKIQLLEETVSLNRAGYQSYSVDRKLTKDAETAFTTIFNEVLNAARVQSMDSRLFAELNEKVKAQTYTALSLKNDFEKYDKDKDGMWTSDDFLAFITESCSWSQVVAWKYLSH